jgi:predicted nucleotidyltransferase
MSKDTILNIIRKEKPFLAEKYHISEIGLFGSYARNEEKETSDIDILVDFPSGSLSLFGLVGLKNYLEDRLGKKVDLVHKPMIRPNLRAGILGDFIMV